MPSYAGPSNIPTNLFMTLTLMIKLCEMLLTGSDLLLGYSHVFPQYINVRYMFTIEHLSLRYSLLLLS